METNKSIIQNRFVSIEGGDIELPPTSGNLAPQEKRTYSFYVWAYDPDLFTGQTTLADLRAAGLFSLEVIGVKAAIMVPDYVPADPFLVRPEAASPNPETLRQLRTTRNVLEVQVRSEDITKPFSIIAWFPTKFMSSSQDESVGPNGLKKNPFGDRKDVKVYSGDVRTRIEIVDQKEAEASFGRQFAKHFYIGRVYLRNKHQKKRLLIYSTSMRAKVLFYRPPVPENQRQNTNAVVTPASARAGVPPMKQSEIERIFQKATRVYPSLQSDQSSWDKRADSIANEMSPGSDQNREKERQTIRTLLLASWSKLEEAAAEWTHKGKLARNEAITLGQRIHQEIAVSPALMAVLRPLLEAPEFSALERNYQLATNSLANLSSETPLSQDANASVRRNIDLIRAHIHDAISFESFARAIRENSLEPLAVPESLLAGRGAPLSRFKLQMKALEDDLVRSTLPATPFSHELDILMNPQPRALAFSKDLARQNALSEVGYLWHETYRPMTFQSVLNSVIFSHENDPRTKTVRYIESAARLAGGMVGLGTVINEFASLGYAQGVSVFSAVVLPELRAHLLEDLNAKIRNLGETSLDTVIVIPPNDAVDRYVFFPRGPIFNRADELNVDQPFYIVSIDNDDLAVEATLIEQDTVVRGGGLDASRLVDRALNEGKADFDAQLQKQAELNDTLRRFELSGLIARIEAILGDAPVPKQGEPKSIARMKAEAEVLKEVGDFEGRHGRDKTGMLTTILRKFGVSEDTPPVTTPHILPRPIRVLAGTVSEPFPLPVTDRETAHALLGVTNKLKDEELIKPSNVEVRLPAMNERNTGITFIVNLTNIGPERSGRALNTFQIYDQSANVAELDVEIEIEKPDLNIIPGQGTQANNSNLQLTHGGSDYAGLAVSLPLFASRREGWSIELISSNAVVYGDTNLAQVLLSSGGAVLTRPFLIDASRAFPNTKSIEFTAIAKVPGSTNQITKTFSITK